MGREYGVISHVVTLVVGESIEVREHRADLLIVNVYVLYCCVYIIFMIAHQPQKQIGHRQRNYALPVP